MSCCPHKIERIHHHECSSSVTADWLSEAIIGFLLLEVATSLPELTINILSVLEGTPLGIANLIGSNIVDTTIILGLMTFIGTFRVAGFMKE